MDIWELVNNTRKDAKTLIIKQYDDIYEYLIKNSDIDEINKLSNEWSDKAHNIVRLKDYNNLHISNGGIVDGGDDSFFMDFSDWIIAQGEDLYNKAMVNGASVIKDYIINNEIDESEFSFENVSYAFSEAKDFLSGKGRYKSDGEWIVTRAEY